MTKRKAKDSTQQPSSSPEKECRADVLRLECKLNDLLETYLHDASEQGVVLDGEGCEPTSLDAFDFDHLVAADAAGFSSAGRSVVALEDSAGPTDSTAQAHESYRSSKKAKLGIEPGHGNAWVCSSVTPSASQDINLQFQSPSLGQVTIRTTSLPPTTPAGAYMKPTPGSKSSRTKEASGKGNRRGKTTGRQVRGGSGTILVNGVPDTLAFDTMRLRRKLIKAGEKYQSGVYSILQHGSVTSTGWQGHNRKPKDRQQIDKLYKSGKIYEIVATFQFAGYSGKPMFVFDKDNRLFVYRTQAFLSLREQGTNLYNAINKLLQKTLEDPDIKRANANGVRGPHFPCIIGHYRQYTSRPYPQLTDWHAKHLNSVNEFLETPVIKEINKRVNSLVTLMFPGVAERFQRSAEWYQTNHDGVKPLFGNFWNLCINGIFVGQEEQRIHCLPHADAQNVIAVCVLVIYEIPGSGFNHRKRCWLVLWEAGIVIELPPWTMLAYPSSLIYHFNIDIKDFKFVTTEGDDFPTPFNSTPITPGDEQGRGSLVYFNQATFYRCSELNGKTVQTVKEGGGNAEADYPASIKQAFLENSKLIPL